MSAVSTIILSQVPTKFNAKADIPERTGADLHCKEKRDVLNRLKFGKYKMGIAICLAARGGEEKIIKCKDGR